MGLPGLGFGAETITTLHKGVPAQVGPYAVTLDSVGERAGPNYKEAVASVTVRSGDAVVAKIEPARRQFAARGDEHDASGPRRRSISARSMSRSRDPAPDGAVPARLYWKPLVTLIWLGGARDGARRRAVARRPAPALRRRRAGEGRRARWRSRRNDACAGSAAGPRPEEPRRGRLEGRSRDGVAPAAILRDASPSAPLLHDEVVDTASSPAWRRLALAAPRSPCSRTK